jgi:hypothetical protein
MLDPERSFKTTNIECNKFEFSNVTNTTTSTIHTNEERNSLMCSCLKQGNYNGPPCFNRGCQHFIKVNDSFYSIQREVSEQAPEYENGLGVLLPLQCNVHNFNIDSGCNQFKVVTDNSSPGRIQCRDENLRKDHDFVCLSVVERARQREIGKNSSHEQKLSTVDHNEAIKSSSKTTFDVALAFRSPHRQRNFKKYTINDYRRQQTASCAHLGKLGPNLEDEELGEKREKLERMKEFSRIVRTCNTAQITDEYTKEDQNTTTIKASKGP